MSANNVYPGDPFVTPAPSSSSDGTDGSYLLPHSRDHHGNDYAASLVPIQLPSSSITEVLWEESKVSIFFSGRPSVVLDGVVFDVLDDRPEGSVAHTSSGGILMTTDVSINHLPPETCRFWPQVKKALNISYGSQDPRAQTMFDGHFLTPVAHEYVNYLPGMSRWRAFLPLAGVVVWAYYYGGVRHLHFQAGSAACETDASAICGARISLSPLVTSLVFQMPWTFGPPPEMCAFSTTPSLQYMELEYGSPIALRSPWPVFLTSEGLRFCRVPSVDFHVVFATKTVACKGYGLPPSGGYCYEWEENETISLTPSLYGYSSALGSSEIVKATTPRGHVMPSLVLQGLGCGLLPSVPLQVVYRMRFEKLEPGRFGVILSDNARRFPVPYGVATSGDPRYAFRHLKHFKAIVKYVRVVSYDWKDQRAYDPINLVQQPIGWFFQNHRHEFEMFVQWYTESGSKTYTAVACEYLISRDVGAGDVLLRHNDTGDYVCLEVKTTSKGVAAQAHKYAAGMFQRLVYAGNAARVFPATLVRLTFTLYPVISYEGLKEYNVFSTLPKGDIRSTEYHPPWEGIQEDL